MGNYPEGMVKPEAKRLPTILRQLAKETPTVYGALFNTLRPDLALEDAAQHIEQLTRELATTTTALEIETDAARKQENQATLWRHSSDDYEACYNRTADERDKAQLWASIFATTTLIAVIVLGVVAL